ncbi:hypothetical protein CRYUN_Cryun07bG0035500 [Craigia yunnanensis]
MLGLLSFKRVSSLISSKATTFSSSSSRVHSLPYKTISSISKPTPQNQVLFNPFHHYSLVPWRSSSQPSLAGKLLSLPVLVKQFWYFTTLNTHYFKVSGKTLLGYCRVWTFLRVRAQVDPKPGVKLGSVFDLLWNRWRSMFKLIKGSDIILGLIIINVAVLLMWGIADNKFMINHFTISVDNFINGRVHTLITSAFSHTSPGILISNMIGLATFGINLERIFGPAYLLKLYLAGAISGSLIHLVYHAFLAFSSKGANGAVCAIMMLGILLFPRATVYVNFVLPVPATLVVSLLLDYVNKEIGNSHISGSADLGGAVVAAIEWSRIRKGRFF